VTGWRSRPLAWAAAAVAGAVVLGGLATAVQAEPPAPPAAVATPVVDTTLACPGLRSREGYTDSTVAAATPPGSGAAAAGDAAQVGRAVVRTLTTDPSASRRLITLSEPGERGRYTGRNGERDAVVGRGIGTLAPGFSVTQTERTVDGAGRGLASTSCLPTGSDFWFVGAASGVGQLATLVLTNPEDATASVDVDFLGRRGPLEAPAARGVQVKPRSTTELKLADLVPGEPVLAVHVKVTSGRLSAALTETDVDGLQPRGTDWVPSTSAPADRALVAGFPGVAEGRKGQATLDVAVPGEADAVVTVELLTPDGSFQPASNKVLDVRAGTVRSFDLTRALRGQATTVRLVSDQPIVAGGRMVLQRPGAYGDSLFLAAVPPLTTTAVVPDNRASSDLVTRLILTAPEGDATVTVTAFDGPHSVRRALAVPAGSTRVFTIEDPQAGQGFGLVITPDRAGGPVVGVRFLDEEGSRGPLVSALPLRPARITATVRQAQPWVAAGMAGQVP
jgi:hypothetical protein